MSATDRNLAIATGQPQRSEDSVQGSVTIPERAYSVKVSVFITPAAPTKGAGRALNEALFEALGRADVHRAFALIVAPTPAPVRLHVPFGLRPVSTLDEVGRKYGRSDRVMWLEKGRDGGPDPRSTGRFSLL